MNQDDIITKGFCMSSGLNKSVMLKVNKVCHSEQTMVKLVCEESHAAFYTSYRTPTAIQGVKNLQYTSHRHSEPQYHFWGVKNLLQIPRVIQSRQQYFGSAKNLLKVLHEILRALNEYCLLNDGFEVCMRFFVTLCYSISHNKTPFL